MYREGDVDIGFWTTVVCDTVLLARHSCKEPNGAKKTERNLAVLVGDQFADG